MLEYYMNVIFRLAGKAGKHTEYGIDDLARRDKIIHIIKSNNYVNSF